MPQPSRDFALPVRFLAGYARSDPQAPEVLFTKRPLYTPLLLGFAIARAAPNKPTGHPAIREGIRACHLAELAAHPLRPGRLLGRAS